MAGETSGVYDIVEATRSNEDYRRVMATGATSQLVLMTLQSGEAIGEEVHEDVDQFLVAVTGAGEAVLGGEPMPFGAGQLTYVPAGTRHDIRNSGSEPLRLYTIYAPPEHPDGTVHRNKAEADEYEAHHHGY